VGGVCRQHAWQRICQGRAGVLSHQLGKILSIRWRNSLTARTPVFGVSGLSNQLFARAEVEESARLEGLAA
jgi:hypothetical protein